MAKTQKIPYYETFTPTAVGGWKKGSIGTYTRNPNETCSATIYEAGSTPGLYFIEKTNATWDKDSNGNTVSPSYSICWKIGNVAYGMGLPTDINDRQTLKNLL
jgi:hypothetical protein